MCCVSGGQAEEPFRQKNMDDFLWGKVCQEWKAGDLGLGSALSFWLGQQALLEDRRPWAPEGAPPGDRVPLCVRMGSCFYLPPVNKLRECRSWPFTQLISHSSLVFCSYKKYLLFIIYGAILWHLS